MFRWIKNYLLKFLHIQKVKRITIEKGVIDDLSYMAREAHPKEIIAFFSATKGIQNGTLHINEIQLQAYEASNNSAHFWLHQLPTFTSIVGTVHSHPSSSTRPSNADLDLFSHYGLVHAIIGEPYRRNNITFYDKHGQLLPVSVLD